MEEEQLSEEDIKWLLAHTDYDDKELSTMLNGRTKTTKKKYIFFSF